MFGSRNAAKTHRRLGDRDLNGLTCRFGQVLEVHAPGRLSDFWNLHDELWLGDMKVRKGTMNKLTTQVASVPDEHGLVVEVWKGKSQLAEMYRVEGTDEPRVRIFAAPATKWWDLPIDDVLNALTAAARTLEECAKSGSLDSSFDEMK